LLVALVIVSVVPAWGRGQAVLHPPVAALRAQPILPQQPEPTPGDDKRGEKPLRDDVKKIETLTTPLPVPADLGQAPQPIDLPTALRLADDQNPEIAFARERIREALAQQNRAEVLWLPHLEVGVNWTRHDGQIQATTGEVITVSRSSLFV